MGVFENLSKAFPSVADHVTVYASSHDKALGLSNIFHQFRDVGRSLMRQHPLPITDIIDASVMSDDLFSWNHDNFAGNVLVLENMGYLVRSGLPPGQRALLDPKPNGTAPAY